MMKRKKKPTDTEAHAVTMQQGLHSIVTVATMLTAGGRVLKDTFNFTDDLIARWQRETAVMLVDEMELAGSLARRLDVT